MLNLLSCTMVYESIIPRHKVSLCKLAVLCTHHREVRQLHPITSALSPESDKVKDTHTRSLYHYKVQCNYNSVPDK